MTWHEAIITLSAPECPAAAMQSGGIQCMAPGQGGLARGRLDAPGWEAIDDDLVRPTSPCAQCPAQQVRHVVVSQADVRPGRVTLKMHSQDRSAFLAVLQDLRSQEPQIDRIGLASTGQRSREIDLDKLTPRQWQALAAAHEMGYFSGQCDVRTKAAHVAKRMGVARSTAHEHLQKALAALTEAAVDTHT